MSDLSESSLLDELRARGALRLQQVRLRRNRSTIWSLTQRATVLNVHVAFRRAEPEILDALALIAREGGVGSRRAARASEMVIGWPALAAEMQEFRADYDARRAAASCDGEGGLTHCCGTPEQRAYLRAVFAYFNHTRFAGRLPRVPVRLSSRMRSALGHMVPGERDGERYVVEIALNVDLMLEGNGAERVDTLLHEMAHAADYLESGTIGHGRSWRDWAVRVGCSPELLYDRPVRRRRRRAHRVTRVPPLPPAVARSVA